MRKVRAALKSCSSGSRAFQSLIGLGNHLGKKPLPGTQLRYFAYAGERLAAVLGFGASALEDDNANYL